jgi:hypothetical protein
MTNCYARVYATGHADAGADAPEEWKSAVKQALSYSMRLTVFVDKQVLLGHLRTLSVPEEVAVAIADTARVTSDDAFFRGR